MVFYSPDDIFSNITWQFLGYPGDGLFLMHEAFPKLKVTIQTVPENRYLGEIPNRNIEKDPVAAGIWRDLFEKPEFRTWLEFGNHGYYHSPEGDPDLDHHEFNAAVNPVANDSVFCFRTFAMARATYAALGLENDRIMVMRFPGFAYTPMALQAISHEGFLAYFGVNPIPGREQAIPLPGGREILSIPSLPLWILLDTDPLTAALDSGIADSSDFRESEGYRTVLSGAIALAEGCIRNGGIVNIFDHWWEHSQTWSHGIRYRYELFKDLLADLDARYGDRIWWGFGSELARWLHLTRTAKVTLQEAPGILVADFTAPGDWRPAWSMDLSYTLSHAGTTGFPPVHRIYYALESEDYGTHHELGENDYWIEGDDLNFSFPFPCSARVFFEFE